MARLLGAEEIIHLMYGTQAYNGDYHLAGFTASTLDHQLRKAGLLVCEATILHGWLFDVRARKTDHLEDGAEFVQSAYFSILGRPADSGGLATFSEALTTGRMTRSAIEEVLRNSDEARFLADNPAYLLPHAARLDVPLERIAGPIDARVDGGIASPPAPRLAVADTSRFRAGSTGTGAGTRVA